MHTAKRQWSIVNKTATLGVGSFVVAATMGVFPLNDRANADELAVGEAPSADAVMLAQSAGTGDSAGTGNGASANSPATGDSPDTPNSPDTADSPNSPNSSPDSANSPNTGGSANSPGTGDSPDTPNSPDTADSPNSPNSSPDSANSPNTGGSANSPATGDSPDTPNSPDTADSPNSPNSSPNSANSPNTGGSPDSPNRATDRIAGPDRITTAVTFSQRQFPTGAMTAYLSDAYEFADALAASVVTDGPILLVPTDGQLPPEVCAEIARLMPTTVVALGGEAAVSTTILTQAADC